MPRLSVKYKKGTDVQCLHCGKLHYYTHEQIRESDTLPCKTPKLPAKLIVLQALAKFDSIKYGELTVLVWNADKKRFGLSGYENEYPDAKRVYTELSHCQSSRYVKRIGINEFAITALGRAYIKDLT